MHTVPRRAVLTAAGREAGVARIGSPRRRCRSRPAGSGCRSMTLARPGSGTGTAIGWSVRSAFSIPTATATGAPVLAGAADRRAEGVDVLVPGDRRGIQRRRHRGGRGGQQDAETRQHAPGAEQVVHAERAGDRVAVLVERDEAGGGRQRRQRAPPAGRMAASSACASPPPCRQRAATASARAAAAPTADGSRCSVDEAGGGGQSAIGRRRQEGHLVVAVGQHDGGRQARQGAAQVGSAIGPPASGDACSIRRASAPV